MHNANNMSFHIIIGIIIITNVIYNFLDSDK